MRDSQSTRRTGLVILAVLLGLALCAPTLADPLLADSHGYRLKARILGPWQLYVPSLQWDVVNPYYRPLFVNLHSLFDGLVPGSALGLRLLALLCHGAAAAALARLGRILGIRDGAIAAAVLLFLWTPANAATATWPVVAYWSLAAALSLLTAGSLVRYVAAGRLRSLAAALGFAAAGILTSQTPYHLPLLAGWLFLLPFAAERSGARRRAALAGLALSAPVAVHFLWIARAGGLAGGLLDRARKVLETAPDYWAASLGGDLRIGFPWLPPIAGALVLALALLGQRRHAFLVGFAALAALPFAALGYSDRFAYFGTAPVCLLAASSLLEVAPRRIPGAKGRTLAGAALGVLLAAALFGAVLRIGEVRAAARATGGLERDLAEVMAENPDLDGVAFLNAPRMLRLGIAEQRRAGTRDEFAAANASFINLTMFATDHAYFGPADLSDRFTTVLQCDGERLVQRDPTRPMGERTALAERCFLARDFEVFEPPPPAFLGRRTGPRDKLAYQRRIRAVRDPRDRVVLERAPPGLAHPLGTGSLTIRIEATDEPDPGGDPVTRGVVLRGRLVADVELDRPGLLVVVVHFAAPDPIAALSGTEGRSCDLLEAELDGQPVAIEPVFFHLTGIPVPAGRHQVVVRPKNRAGADG